MAGAGRFCELAERRLACNGFAEWVLQYRSPWPIERLKGRSTQAWPVSTTAPTKLLSTDVAEHVAAAAMLLHRAVAMRTFLGGLLDMLNAFFVLLQTMAIAMEVLGAGLTFVPGMVTRDTGQASAFNALHDVGFGPGLLLLARLGGIARMLALGFQVCIDGRERIMDLARVTPAGKTPTPPRRVSGDVAMRQGLPTGSIMSARGLGRGL